MSFEMITRNIATRSASTACNMSLSALYSVEEPLTDIQLKQIYSYYQSIVKQDTYFIDCAGTPQQIADSLYHYWEKYCARSGRVLVYVIDHVKLIKKMPGQSDIDLLDTMMTLLVDLKKKIATAGGKSLGYVLSQLNREITKDNRVLNKEMHRPDPSCLYASSAIEFACDLIVCPHIPAKIGIQSYTTENLPTWYMHNGIKLPMAYLEVIKNRSGISDVTIPLYNKLNRFNFDEMESEVFDDLRKQWHEDKTNIPEIRKQSKLKLE